MTEFDETGIGLLKSRRKFMSSKAKSLFTFISFLIGVVFFITYLLSLRNEDCSLNILFLWTGAGFMSSMLVFSLFHKHEKMFVLALYLSSLSLLVWAQLRFSKIFGTDVLSERVVAEQTLRYGWSTPVLSELHGNTLSVTILPAIVSEVTGMTVLNTFEFILPIVSAFLPIFLFIFIRRMTGSTTVAGLSSILFIYDYAYLTVAAQIMRQNISLIFLLTIFYTLFQGRKWTANLTVLIYLAIFGVISSHYTTTLIFLAFIIILKIFSFLRVPRILINQFPKKQQKTTRFVPNSILLFSFVAALAWQVFIVNYAFSTEVSEGWDIFKRIVGLRIGFFHPYTKYVTIFPRGGIFNSVILWLYRLLILLGIPITIKQYRNNNTRLFILLGLCTFFTLGASTVLPQISDALHLDRVYFFALPFFSFFAVSSILWVSSSAKSALSSRASIVQNQKEKVHYVLVCFLISLFFINSIAILPSFYYLPKSSMPVEELASAPFQMDADVEFSEWLNRTTSKNVFFLADMRAKELLWWNLRIYHPKLRTSLYSVLEPYSPSYNEQLYISLLDYTMERDYVVEYYRISIKIPNATLTEMPSGRVVTYYPTLKTHLMEEPIINLIFNNEHDYLFHTRFPWDPTK